MDTTTIRTETVMNFPIKKKVNLKVWPILLTMVVISISLASHTSLLSKKAPKAVFIIADGVPADVIKKLKPRTLTEISMKGGLAEAHVGGTKDGYNQTPTISAPGYISLLTGTWGNKHNVWDNDIAAPNYHYKNIFRVVEEINPALKTAVFSTWLDNRTKLIGEGLERAGAIQLDHKFDGLEHDTIRYPHDSLANHILKIDEAVTDEAARHISTVGPDLSWVYLEYTDDMGHRFGDSPQLYDAVAKADLQIKKVWDAIQRREKQFNEDWLIVITTDHGRDATTGKDHGGQTDRERRTWIVTNAKNLNERFQRDPGIVDIFPSVLHHLNLRVPESVKNEIDGIPFIGPVDLSRLRAHKTGKMVTLRWENLGKKSEKLEILLATTNNFKNGGQDQYFKVGESSTDKETFSFEPKDGSTFLKILVKGRSHSANTWIVIK